jgi:hypothetical protein
MCRICLAQECKLFQEIQLGFPPILPEHLCQSFDLYYHLFRLNFFFGGIFKELMRIEVLMEIMITE